MNNKIFSAIGALITWFALIAQLFLAIGNRSTSIAEAVMRYFGYFTILTNLIVAVYFTAMLLPDSRLRRFFRQTGVLTAITVYICVVGLVYQLFLRHIWDPQGLQRLVDELLHSAIPVLFLVYWILYEKKETLRWRFMLTWLIYPFIDISKLGYQHALTNAFGLMIIFFFFSGAFIGIARLTIKR
jgi:hypothetical protein